MNGRRILLSVLACALFAFQFVFVVDGFCTGINEVQTEKIAVDLVRDTQKAGYGIVRTDELKQWMDQKKNVLIVCASPKAGYDKGHFPGAVSFELPIPEMTEMSDAQKAAFIKTLGPDKDRVVVFYCGFTKCTRSHNGAMWAKTLGYKHAYRCPGGIKGWTEAGFPIEKTK
ncbi:rhodanese-like domain-containing protein [uncultured Desulfosarcina sp.]|uniref:rhodanese-like domain-containing protein n=1 Tax=uncultured Desulfosarcina sp. TaxID=218289 RepID=UPI0029C61964|nr:rhodanese-like domain-containing protein [uncultured Desulfosarcina sp.]